MTEAPFTDIGCQTTLIKVECDGIFALHLEQRTGAQNAVNNTRNNLMLMEKIVIIIVIVIVMNDSLIRYNSNL